MVRKLAAITIILMLCAVLGCAGSINKASESYTETSAAVKNFAAITAKDWLFGSGVIQGAIPESAVPAWVFDELRMVDAWIEAGEELTDQELGYIVGLRIRLTGPIVKAAIDQYAPALLGIKEVGMVLSFIGL